MFEKGDIRVAPIPRTPSRQEALEHACTHVPFRSWCPHCVRGKAKSGVHRSNGGSAASDKPVVAFDYAFLGERPIEDPDDAEPHIKVLVGRDSHARVYWSCPVPQKGLDNEEYAVRQTLRFLDFLGYNNLVLKSDQEPALGAVLKKVRVHRGMDTQNMIEHSAVGDSKQNGFIERAIQQVEGQIRTLRDALESNLGIKLRTDDCVVPWMVAHAGNLLTLYEIGPDGRSPFQRLRGAQNEARSLRVRRERA